MRSLLALLQKELRQNSVLFLVPPLVLLAAFLARVLGLLSLGGQWLDIAARTVPIALAVAYGLQTFDLEENGRTRDFLLTKPLTPWRIVSVKFCAGLLVLMPLVFLWLLVLDPDSVRAPSFADYSTFWMYGYLLMIGLIYGLCLGAGVFVKGPKKLLFGAFLGGLGAVWILLCYFGLLACVWQYLGQAAAIWAWFAVGFGLFCAVCLTALILLLVSRRLSNSASRQAGILVLVLAAACSLLPLTTQTAALLTRPAITPFTSLFSTYFGGEEWFSTVAAAKLPGGDLYACADAHGRLGLGRKGQKPKEIYRSQDSQARLSGLAWSPDGRYLTFCDQGLIMMYEVRSGELFSLIPGEEALWSSASGQALMVVADQSVAHRYQVYLADLAASGSVPPLLGTIDDPGRLSWAWDAPSGQILMLDHDWRLRLASMASGTVLSVELPPPPGISAPITAGRIFPPGAGASLYRLAVYVSESRPSGREPRYTVCFYDVDPQRRTVKRSSFMRGLTVPLIPDESLLAEPLHSELLRNMGLGVYRSMRAPEEAS